MCINNANNDVNITSKSIISTITLEFNHMDHEQVEHMDQNQMEQQETETNQNMYIADALPIMEHYHDKITQFIISFCHNPKSPAHLTTLFENPNILLSPRIHNNLFLGRIHYSQSFNYDDQLALHLHNLYLAFIREYEEQLIQNSNHDIDSGDTYTYLNKLKNYVELFKRVRALLD